MALDTEALKAGIKQLHDDMITRDVESNEEYATRFANLLETFVKSGSVKAGIHVNTAGSASAQTGATTTEGEIY